MSLTLVSIFGFSSYFYYVSEVETTVWHTSFTEHSVVAHVVLLMPGAWDLSANRIFALIVPTLSIPP